MDKHGHAAKGSNALVASVDFYSSALADAIRALEEQRAALAALAAQVKAQAEESAAFAPVLRSALVWEAAARDSDGAMVNPAIERRLREDVAAYRKRMDDRSSMDPDSRPLEAP